MPYSVQVMRRAVELVDAGWSLRRTRELLADELGVSPAANTIREWAYPERFDALRERQRIRLRDRRVQTAQFRWPGRPRSTPWQVGRMRSLRAAGMSYSAIAKVMNHDFGLELIDHKVAYALRADDSTGQAPNPSVGSRAETPRRAPRKARGGRTGGSAPSRLSSEESRAA